MRRLLPAVSLLSALVLAGCGGGHANVAAPSPATTPTPVPAPTQPTTPGPTATASPGHNGGGGTPTKLLVFVEENHSQSQVLSGMPYLASLAGAHGHATAYDAETHPSLPNSLALVGGSTFGVQDDAPPRAHPLSGDSVFDQAIAHGRSAKTYAESMPSNCYLSASGDYAVKHNAWAYFADSTPRSNCNRFDVAMGTTGAGALASDIATGSLPNVGFAIPNLCNDAHNCPLSTADDWLHEWIPRIMSGSDYRSGRLAIVVTFDEDDRNAGNNVATVVISPRTRQVTSSASYDHYSSLRCADEILGVPLLRAAAAARSLCPAFGL